MVLVVWIHCGINCHNISKHTCCSICTENVTCVTIQTDFKSLVQYNIESFKSKIIIKNATSNYNYKMNSCFVPQY